MASRRPQLSLDHLRGFRVAARYRSFTRAAQELYVTQSAISQGIKALEAQLGQPLFHRVHRGLQLTPAGEALYRAVDDAFGQIESAVDRLLDAGETVGVTATTGFASLWLAPRLPRFNRAHPGADVRVVASNDRPDLERDALDVAIRFVAAGGDAPQGERLIECWSFPVCSPALARDPQRPLRAPEGLARHVRLDYETIRDGRRVSEWDFWFDARRLPPVRPASTLRFPQYDQVVAAAMEGSGVAMGEWPHLAPHLRDGVLCAPFGMGEVAARGTYYVVRRTDAAPRPAVQAFVEWLWEEARRQGQFSLGSAPAMRRAKPVVGG